MSGFQSPNWTQVPNDLFEMMNTMSDAELRVVLVMIRQTKGFHRTEFKMGINKLADSAGLSRNGAKDGAIKAEARGVFRRINPDEQSEAEWELVIEDGQPVTTPGQPVEGGGSASDQQVGVKERLNKESKEAKKILSKADPAWSILAGAEITQEQLDENKLEKEAQDAFESAFDGMKITWRENKEWIDFADFVLKAYREDKASRQREGNCWIDYCKWRKEEGKYGKAMTNLAIRRRPRDFMDVAWATFLASSAMYPKRGAPDVDEHGAPISY